MIEIESKLNGGRVSLNTVEKGNQFRDAVDALLNASGFRTDPEARIKFKKADNFAVWTQDSVVDGQLRLGIEAKDYEGNLTKKECIEFLHEYGSLIESRDIDRAWLVSKNPISPDGRALLDNKPGIQAFTYLQLQRHLFQTDPYLRTIIQERDNLEIPEYYVRPFNKDGDDLEAYVRKWIDADVAPPLFVLGGYGLGKTTFALNLGAELAKEALQDPAKLVPVLIRLGEYADEQSLDGLVGKILASRYRVPGYHFQAFMQLNRNGRFVVIYDAFDEMKHGMSFAKFHNALKQLMLVDEPDARVLILGRPTSLQDDYEFQAVIGGLSRTRNNQVVPSKDSRARLATEIRGFNRAEIPHYIRRYLPVRAKKAHAQIGKPLENEWLEQRIQHLLSGRFDDLLLRPVHASMLCQIAADPRTDLGELSVYQLYDQFVHYLHERETEKQGRHPSLTPDTRRQFDASLAWWLWQRGGASSTTIADIPESLATDAAAGARHDLDNHGLKRELVQACMVEKTGETVYFSHRSLQEFLVAEHLLLRDVIAGPSSATSCDAVVKTLNPEIVTFLVSGVEMRKDGAEVAARWVSRCETMRSQDIPLQGFDLFVQLANKFGLKPSTIATAWNVWLAYFRSQPNVSLTRLDADKWRVLRSLYDTAVAQQSEEAQAAAIYLMVHLAVSQKPKGKFAPPETWPFASLIDLRLLTHAVDEARAKRRFIVRRTHGFGMWTFIRHLSVEPGNTVVVGLDLVGVLTDALSVLKKGFSLQRPTDDGFDKQLSKLAKAENTDVSQILKDLTALGHKEIASARTFFTRPEIRDRVKAMEVEYGAVKRRDS